ncbi:spermidine/putrescine ABC transporter substrate-binding protein [Mesorhizobium loti]|nr:ABC transporter substrate-binding protein [Mesorhizobium loti]PLP59321.1 spermidine/putrescine ABC transporter substrate-binding protein [Mesorhizobium loti]
MTKTIFTRVASVAVTATVLGGLLAGTAAARDLTVVSWGGAYQDAQRKFMFGPFAGSAAIKVVDEYWEGGIGILRTKIKGGDNNWDVVQVEAEEQAIGCEEGLFEKLDYSRIGGKERFLPGTTGECGVGAVIYNVVLAYDTAKPGPAPTGWADFFDTTKFPGKRAMRNGPKWNLEIALLGDGVAPGEIYKVLSTPEGVDRAFKKLDSIKSDLLFWKSGAQPAQMLAAGDVMMTTTFNSRVTASNENDGTKFGIVWKDSLYTMDSWVIMKGSPLLDQSYQLVEYATRAAPQAALPQFNRSGPTNKDAIALVPAAYMGDLPSNQDNFKVAIPDSPDFWIDNFDDLNERWSAWAGSN